MESNLRKDNNNIDAANLKVLEDLSGDWWDPNSEVICLHSINPVRISLIRDELINTGRIKAADRNKPDVLKGFHILDVGCGAGVLAEPLARMGAKITAIDPSEVLIRVAKEHLGNEPLDIEYMVQYIEEHSINNPEKYDVVIASEVIEHVPDQRALLDELSKCVKPNGSIFITTPNRTLISWFGMLIAEHILGILAKGAHDWYHFIRPSEVEKILNEKNCKTVAVRGIWYTPFFNIYNIIRYAGMHYGLHAIKQENKKNK
ncbi:hypothetical protein ACKWTF_010570 [Chironomus riparius]